MDTIASFRGKKQTNICNNERKYNILKRSVDFKGNVYIFPRQNVQTKQYKAINRTMEKARAHLKFNHKNEQGNVHTILRLGMPKVQYRGIFTWQNHATIATK